MVNYTLAAGRMESEQLMVRSDTGDICVRTPLDRETAPYLEIPVIATDRGTYHSSDHSPWSYAVQLFYDKEQTSYFLSRCRSLCRGVS